MNDVELTNEERSALSRLKGDFGPPEDLERRIAATLRARGLIGPRQRRAARWLAAAAIVVSFVAGAQWQRTVTHPTAPRFVLFLYEGDTNRSAARHAEYANWARAVSKHGVSVDGEELAPEHVSLPTGAAPTGGEPRGYFTVSAATLAEARDVASSCPHLRYGGRVVIRPVVH